MQTSSSSSSYTLRGRTLLLARVIWLALFASMLAVLIAASVGLTGWGQPCALHPEAARCLETEAALHTLGLSLNFYAVFFSLAILVETLPWVTMGLLIFWRKAVEPYPLIFSLMLVVSGVMTLDSGIRGMVRTNYPALDPGLALLSSLGAALLGVWFFFPNGRLAHPRFRWPLMAWLALITSAELFPSTRLDFSTWPDPLPEVINVLITATIISSVIYHYLSTSNPLQRQQVKWVVLGASFLGMLRLIGYLVPKEQNPTAITIYLGFMTLYYLASAFVGVSLGFSILRYRLWDIDFIINRSLVYGALTGMLLAFFGLALWALSQFLSSSLLPAVVISALGFGMVFQPARRGLQRFVDRRFYNIQIDYQRPAPNAPQAAQAAAPAFGPYSRLELLGRGGMGEVYKAQRPDFSEPVALKVLPPALAEKPESRKRFLREAQIIAGLEHPNIVRLLDAGEVAGTAYLAMEFCTGPDLAAHLRSHGRLSVPQALPILHDIAAALDYAHTQGVIHRDIKPSNVMLRGAGAVLMDFGLARLASAHTVLTQSGGMLGTLHYIAPEQIQALPNIDGRADIYALGVMAFEMLTGRLPFQHDNPGALLIAHLTQPPPDLEDLIPEIPLAAAEAIRRALAKAPAQRYVTAGEFVAALA